jgi:hypothetical protein
MTETSSFVVGILVGVVLGTTTILSFNNYFTLNDRNDKNDTISKSLEGKKSSPGIESESVVTKETDFPANWFSSTDNFNLETRAIFSKVDNPTILPHHSQ